jgi:hypothetical protein
MNNWFSSMRHLLGLLIVIVALNLSKIIQLMTQFGAWLMDREKEYHKMKIELSKEEL